MLDSNKEILLPVNVETICDEDNQSVESSSSYNVCAQTDELMIASTNYCIESSHEKRFVNQWKYGYPKLSRCSTFWCDKT